MNGQRKLSFDSLDEFPASAGSYALHLHLDRPAALTIGCLGVFAFPGADYLYLGSARGPGGLRARLRHHARGAARPHWHIDYLRRHASLLGGWLAADTSALECLWSQALRSLAGALIPAPGFGAADCRRGCRSHLLAFPDGLELAEVEACLRYPGAERVIVIPFSFA